MADKFSRVDDGGPAFPLPEGSGMQGRMGMSLRDWFAGQALHNLMEVLTDMEEDERPGADLLQLMATDAYVVADAMLEARRK